MPLFRALGIYCSDVLGLGVSIVWYSRGGHLDLGDRF